MTFASGSTSGSSPHDASEPQTPRQKELAEFTARRAAELRRGSMLGKADWSAADDYWALQLGRRGSRASR